MARKLKPDQVLFLVTLLLVAAGVVMVYSASAMMAAEKFRQPHLFLVKQVMWAALGIAVLHLVMKVDYRHYRRPGVVWTAVGFATVGLLAVFLFPPVKGSHRWIGLGFMGIQPSEFAKLAIILLAAYVLERRMSRINDSWNALAPLGIPLGVFMVLILFEPDFGTAMALLLIAAVVVFSAGLSYRYVFGLALGMLPLAYSLIMGADYRRRRWLAFWNPWENPRDDGYHIIQSLIAVGTGGVAGKGFMAGVQKLFYLPEPHTDFIYAVVGEEWGLIGATVLLAGFGLLTWRGLRVASRAPDSFGAFLAIGVTMMFALQALVNVSVVLGLLPTKGIPLPFVSAGGSSLLVNLLAAGILLNVSQHASAKG